MCIECKNTGVVTTPFGDERVQAFCNCPIGRKRAAEYEAKLPRKYTTSYDEKEVKPHDKAGEHRIISGADEIARAFGSMGM